MFLPLRASSDRSPWGDFWFESVSRASSSGIRVSPDQAMRLAAVYACVNILAKTFAVLPFCLYKPRADGGRDADRNHWLYKLIAKRPNRFQNPFEWRQMVMGHLALRGNAYNEIIDNAKGEITELLPRHPDRIRIDVMSSGEYRYLLKEADGSERIIPRGSMWHLRWLSSDGIVGVNPIECARESIGIGLAAQEYGARFFANDARPGGGWIEHPGQFKDKTSRDTFRESVQNAQTGANRHKLMVLEAGMKFHELAVKNNDAQFLETRKFSVTDIARIFGVPPHLVADLDRATFANIEQQSLEFVIYTMTPITEAVEASIEYSLLPDDAELDPEFDLARLLRGDQAARGSFYSQMFNLGALSTNEIRIREGDNPIEGGDNRFVPVNLRLLEADMTEPDEGDSRPTPSKPVTGSDNSLSQRLQSIALAAADRVARKEIEAGKDMLSAPGFKKVYEFYDKHAAFISNVLSIDMSSAQQYCTLQIATITDTNNVLLNTKFEEITRARLERLALTGSP